MSLLCDMRLLTELYPLQARGRRDASTAPGRTLRLSRLLSQAINLRWASVFNLPLVPLLFSPYVGVLNVWLLISLQVSCTKWCHLRQTSNRPQLVLTSTPRTATEGRAYTQLPLEGRSLYRSPPQSYLWRVGLYTGAPLSRA